MFESVADAAQVHGAGGETDALSRLDYKYTGDVREGRSCACSSSMAGDSWRGHRESAAALGCPRKSRSSGSTKSSSRFLETHLLRMGAKLPRLAAQGMARAVLGGTDVGETVEARGYRRLTGT